MPYLLRGRKKARLLPAGAQVADRAAVEAFLVPRPRLTEHVHEALNRLRAAFPGETVAIEFVPPAANRPLCLMLYAETACEVDEARRRLERIEVEWLLDLPPRVLDQLRLGVAIRPSGLP